MVFQHFGHKAVDAAAYICQQHQHVSTIVPGGERSLDRVHLATNAFNAGNELLLFFIDGCHFFLAYTLGGYGKRLEARISIRAREAPQLHNYMSKDSAQEPPSTRRSFVLE